MDLQPDLSQRFDAALIAYEEDLDMPYITSIRFNATERGLEQGRENGRQERGTALLLHQFGRVYGAVPDAMQHKVRQFSVDQLRKLEESLFDF